MTSEQAAQIIDLLASLKLFGFLQLLFVASLIGIVLAKR